MNAVAVTKGGLTIHNFTRYNTDDIVALAEALEDHNFDGALVSYSEYAPNDAVTLRQAGAPLVVGTPMGDKRRSFFKIHYPEGVNGGTITLANPNKLFELHLEQLAFEMDEEKVLPARFVLELAAALDRHGRPFELHVYEKGRHGIGLGFRPYDGFDTERLHPWTVECRRWLAERGFAGE